MVDFRLGRHASGVCATFALLTGCGGSQMQTAPVATSGVRAATSSYGYCPALSGGTGILPDGDFSQGTNYGQGWSISHKRNIFAPDWITAKRNINFVGSASWDMDNLCSVDLDGGTDGGIATSGFATKIGASYTVTFLFSGNGCDSPEHRGNTCSPEKTMYLMAAKQFQVFAWNTAGDNDAEHGVYAEETWEFRAAGPLTILKFISHDAKTSDRGPVVAAIGVAQD
jgi:hypothetical protein